MSPMSLLTLPVTSLRSDPTQARIQHTSAAPTERWIASAVFAVVAVAAVLACLL